MTPEIININLDADFNPHELEGIANAFESLCSYARTKARAMENRLEGKINDAINLEKQCEVYYNALPNWARW